MGANDASAPAANGHALATSPLACAHATHKPRQTWSSDAPSTRLGPLTSSQALIDAACTRDRRCVLVTGGAGFIGSHTALELLSAGFRVVALDVFDNSSPEALNRVREISQCAAEDLLLAHADMVDLPAVAEVFDRFGPFDACIHFAGFKAVGESVRLPLHYYTNNVSGTLNLLGLLDRHGCHALAFSSSTTVYGDPEPAPDGIAESHPLRSTNPYGRSKLFVEEILRDLAVAAPGKWSVALLRYFNPIGAHPSGRIGEDPTGVPQNLLPFVTQVAVGRREFLSVFGGDYDTPDGTGVRDYIHVVDLAQGHVKAMTHMLASPGMGTHAYNLGTGTGTSVLQVVRAVEKASGRKVPYKIVPRRPGDVAACFADPRKAREELGWEATRTVEDMVADAWRWQEANPHGFMSEVEAEASAQALAGEEQQRKALVFQMYKPQH